MTTNSRVLIIGGTGRIGTCIAEEACLQGYDVNILTRGNIPIHSKDNQYNVITGDWKNDLFAKKIFEDYYDVVIDTLIFNVDQLKRDLSIVNNNCKHFYYISTDSVYARPGIEVREDDSIDETKVLWNYGINKRKAEKYLLAHRNEYDFMITILRPVLTFGDTRIPFGFAAKDEQYYIIKRIKENKPILLMNDGGSKHSICHDSLFGKVTVSTFHKKSSGIDFIHIANDGSFTFDEIAKSLGNVLGKAPLIVHIDAEDLSKIDRNLYQEMIYDKIPTFTVDNTKDKLYYQGPEYSLDLLKVLKSAVLYMENNPILTNKKDDYDLLCDALILHNKKKYIKENPELSNYVNSFDSDYVKKLKIYYRNKYRLRLKSRVKDFIKKVIGK